MYPTPSAFRRLLFALPALLFLTLALPRATATINASLQLQLGNPSNATSDTNNHDHYLIVRSVEALDYSDNLREPYWASWDLTAADVGGSGRSDFIADTNLPSNFYVVQTGDYSGSGYDRGHLCPSADRTDNSDDNLLVFYMSNMMPQAKDNNEVTWANFETYCRSTLSTNEMLIICGPGGFNGSRTTSPGQIAIPSFTWKVAVAVPLGPGAATNRITTATRVIAIEVPNTNGVSPNWQDFITSAGQIERDTGLTFFTTLPGPLASALRSKVDGASYPAPQISSFSPVSGAYGTNVVITGSNFTGASVVAFNGAPAVFSVDSNTQITAVVPGDATSGPISVTTPSGTATSAGNFVIVAEGSLDLAVSCSHTGTFTQGDAADTYSVLVTNTTGLSSSGMVIVSNALPAGLTATSIGGAGWSADLATLTCTRSDVLPGMSAYPPIMLTVSVASDATSPVTNLVVLSGGGDTNLANNVALDPTIIHPPAVPETTTLAGWDVSTQTNYGTSALPPSTNSSGLFVSSLLRGSGVLTNGMGANRALGGVGWTNVTAANAIGSNQFVAFTLSASNGFAVSFSAISQFSFRRSNTGPPNGLLQYQIGSGPFIDVASLSYPATTSSGSALPSIDLSSIPDLQHIGAGTNVTFRIANYGGGTGGTWYIFDTSNGLAPDFVVDGSVTPVAPPAPDLVVILSHSGVFTQADNGDVCDIVVSNAGPTATSGTVSITNLLPSGLIATAISGLGWDSSLADLSCSRNDVLAPGAAFPPIQIVVNVATNAPSSVTNFARVYGGGETNVSNDAAEDVAAITPLTPSEWWRFEYFGSKLNAGAGADTAITAGDGLPNLYKYALGLNPLIAASDPLAADISSGYLSVSVPKNPEAADIEFEVQIASSVLGPWSVEGTIVEEDTSTLLQVRDAIPVSSAPMRFIRLQITRP